MGNRVHLSKRVQARIGWEGARKRKTKYWGTTRMTSFTGNLPNMDGADNHQNGGYVITGIAIFQFGTPIICGRPATGSFILTKKDGLGYKDR